MEQWQEWFRSYFRNRKQFVNVGESNSLPVVFHKDQCLVLNYSSYPSCAENLELILHKFTSKLDKIKRWFDINKLSINLTQIKETSSFSSLRILSKSNILDLHQRDTGMEYTTTFCWELGLFYLKHLLKTIQPCSHP